MVSGIICGICVVLLLLKRFSKKFHKIHIPVGIFLILALVIHIVQTYVVWDKRNVLVIASGIAGAILVIVLFASWLFRKYLRNNFILIHRIGAVMLLIAMLMHIGSYYLGFSTYQTSIQNTIIEGIDVANVTDGEYIGEHSVGYIYTKVRVTVESGQIKDIELLEHGNERGSPAEKIIDKVIDEQSTKVDAVTGATNSSKVILKAIENALNQKK